MSDEDIRFIRNLRPNGVNIRVAGLKLHLDRRGARADSIAVPEAAFSDRGFQRNFANSLIEEISKDDYYALALRLEDAPQERLTFSPTRYEIDAENPTIRVFAKEALSPSLSFEKVSNTEKEAEQLRKQADKAAEKAAKAAGAKRTPREKQGSRSTISHKIEPRKGVIKGVVGGEEIGVIEDD